MNLDPHLRTLIERAKRAPRLGVDEELACIAAWQKRGDRAAAQRLTEANMRHVVFLVMRFRNYGVPLEDLVSDGCEGLMKAMERFDCEKGVRFSTYAVYWIRAFVVQSVMSSWSLLSGPRGALHSRTFFRLRRERAKLLSTGAHGSITPALAERFGVSEERMTEMLGQIDNRGVSLDAPRAGQTVTLLDELSSDLDQEERLIREQQRRALEAVVDGARDSLDERERYILEHRMLADPEDQLSLGDLGARFGVSRERVRQLEVRARLKLRRQAEAVDARPEPRECAA